VSNFLWRYNAERNPRDFNDDYSLRPSSHVRSFHGNSHQETESQMNTLHIYVFGSICRGELSAGSDVELLAAVSGERNDLSRGMFSIYSHMRLRAIWEEGNPFAWHLHLEARLIHASDGHDFLAALGTPKRYTRYYRDCSRFLDLLRGANHS